MEKKIQFFSASNILSKNRVELSDGFYAPKAKMYLNIAGSQYLPEVFRSFLKQGYEMRYGILRGKKISIKTIQPQRFCKAIPCMSNELSTDFWEKLQDINQCIVYKSYLNKLFKVLFGIKVSGSLWFIPRKTVRENYFELYGSEEMILLFCSFGLVDDGLKPLFYPIPFKI
ncbi:MAG: hypothetical protein N2Z58_05735 [Fervidobacterium sp.]|nr:hypothetical protein [Fervidobacterium sp.]